MTVTFQCTSKLKLALPALCSLRRPLKGVTAQALAPAQSATSSEPRSAAGSAAAAALRTTVAVSSRRRSHEARPSMSCASGRAPMRAVATAKAMGASELTALSLHGQRR